MIEQNRLAQSEVVTLSEVTDNNIDALLDLSLKDGQEEYVASVAVSLAQAYVYKEAWPRAIVARRTIVGFLMLSIESDDLEFNSMPKIGLWRLLIDKQFQRLGYGADALKLAGVFALTQGADCLHLSCVPGESGPQAFYEAHGFTATGEVDEDGEVIMVRRL